MELAVAFVRVNWVFWVQIGLVLALVVHLLIRGHWRSEWSWRKIRTAYKDMDALDAREAPEFDYAPVMKVLEGGLPDWAVRPAADRLARPDCRSRERCLKILSESDISPFRELLVDLARDSSDPLAPEIWEMLTGRHRSGWKEALVATDGKAGFGDPPPSRSGRWCGFYKQLGTEHRMQFELQFKGDQFSGGGSDLTGPFTITGSIEGTRMRATKVYPIHTVKYKGACDGDALAGRWFILVSTGRFRLWPCRPRPAAPDKV